MNMKTTLTQKRLQEVLGYDLDTGVFKWRITLGSRAVSGGLAGTLAHQGHAVIRVDGSLYQAHHLAWLYVHGVFSSTPIRHKNGDRSNNRFNNLIQASKSEIASHLQSSKLTPENVGEVFEYRDGKLFWRESLTGRSRIRGQEAGHINTDGYVVIEVGGKAHGAHRLVWLMHKGAWPVGEIDHRNGVRSDNRIDNLRDVIHQTNTENRRDAIQGSSTGLLGVERQKNGKYRARIRANGVLHRLGTFDSAQAAHEAYVEAKRSLHGGCTI